MTVDEEGFELTQELQLGSRGRVPEPEPLGHQREEVVTRKVRIVDIDRGRSRGDRGLPARCLSVTALRSNVVLPVPASPIKTVIPRREYIP